ncbi:pro-FMRFamide-related neuropeptide VF [Amia ocellicauda]|uniref:pro-FMRFamide-related neuropeptide VF n=1 Tax=Amia ocellicauda TaxID=2972642 RepID=UPI003464542B
MTRSDTCLLTLLVVGFLSLRSSVSQSVEEYMLSAAGNPQTNEEQPFPEPRLENMQEELRSIDMENIKDIVPTIANKIRLPFIQKLSHSVTNLPLRFGRAPQPVANLPLRFGRAMPEGVVRMPKAALSLPPHIGRSFSLGTLLSPQYDGPLRSVRASSPSATLPQRFGRASHYQDPLHLTAALALMFGSALLDSRAQDPSYLYALTEDLREEGKSLTRISNA